MIKPGYKTTEFWVTLLGLAVSAAVALGWVPAADQELINGWIYETVEAVLSLAAIAVVAREYIRSRTSVKTS